MKTSILGTQYEIIETNERAESKLENCYGYHDGFEKVICLDTDKLHKAEMRAQTLRHEIIHAYLYECGLAQNCDWHCEEMVDWLAFQIEKITRTIKELE